MGDRDTPSRLEATKEAQRTRRGSGMAKVNPEQDGELKGEIRKMSAFTLELSILIASILCVRLRTQEVSGNFELVRQHPNGS